MSKRRTAPRSSPKLWSYSWGGGGRDVILFIITISTTSWALSLFTINNSIYFNKTSMYTFSSITNLQTENKDYPKALWGKVFNLWILQYVLFWANLVMPSSCSATQRWSFMWAAWQQLILSSFPQFPNRRWWHGKNQQHQLLPCLGFPALLKQNMTSSFPS